MSESTRTDPDAVALARGRPRPLAAPAAARGLRRPGGAQGQLAVSIDAARARGEALDHVLLAGPPGLGKTSLAQIVAAELDVPFVQTAGPALERKGDIAAFLTALEPRSVFFVDEIHRLPRALEETFYPAMEDRRLPITVGQGAGARVVTIELPPFTLIGATTRTGLLTTPLRDRFGIQPRLEHYSARRARRDRPALGRRSSGSRSRTAPRWRSRARSRGTPRVANRLLDACATTPRSAPAGSSATTVAAKRSICSRSTSSGLDRLDREILSAICEKFARRPGRPVDARRGDRRGAATRSRTSTSRTCSSAA